MRRMAGCLSAIAVALAVQGIAQQASTQPTAPTETATAQQAVSAPPSTRGRKKIGLVFEGGGALGLAHIGVIRWLERHHIPVDYVAGTSMGGLVGGLYASGLGSDEIEAFVKDIDWGTVLSGQVPFGALSYRRKEDKVAFPNRSELGLKGGISLPGGLNSGAAVNLLFDRTLLPYWDLQSFDDLPIPFRCVATELNTGQAHVFDSGPLPRALRSTMSIPGVFAPVKVGNDLYSDGAAVDNLPVDIAKSMGAEVIISSYLNAGPPPPGSLDSLVGVAGRNVAIMVAGNEVESLKRSDVVISSDVSKFGSLEFSRSAEIIPTGEEGAALEAMALEKYSLNDADWARYLAQRQARRRTAVPVPQFVEISGLNGAEQQNVASQFRRFVGKPVDTSQIENRIGRLQGTGMYSTVNFNIVERNGREGLLIRPQAKSYGPPFMNFGLTILANDSNNVQLGVGLRATYFNIVGPGSEVRLDGMVGQSAGSSLELFRPFTPDSHAFVAPHAYYMHLVNPYFQGNQQLEQYKENRNGIGFDLGYQFNSRLEARVGEDVVWFGEHRTIGTPSAQEFNLTPFVSKVKLQYLDQNDVMVPTSGALATATYNYFTKRPNGAGGFSQMSGRVERFFSVKEHGVLYGAVQGGSSFGADNLGLAGLTVGGPLRLSAYARNELLGTDYFLGQSGYLHLVTRLNPVFADAIYAGAVYEIGKMYGGNAQTPTTPNDVAAAVIVKTFLGPIIAGVSIGDSDHRKWFFGLGRIF